MERIAAPRNAIEVRLVLWALCLNFAWEMLQGGLFVGMTAMAWWEATKLCLRASLGDAVMILLAYETVAIAARDRRWIFAANAVKLIAYAATAAFLGLALEWYSLRLVRWTYGPWMPLDPLLGLGLTPLLQWVFLPLLCVWIAWRGIHRTPNIAKEGHE